MPETALPFRKTEEASIPLSRLERAAQGWFLSGEIAQHSVATLAKRRLMVGKLVWFLKYKDLPDCDLMALRAFFAYLSDKKPIPGGRWGNPQENQPVKPGTVATYHATIRAFFTWAVAEGELPASPMVRIPAPIDRPDQIQPFSAHEINALLAAAKKTDHPRRNEALLLLLLDTGLRASEVCGLRIADLDMTARRVSVEGKGGKTRPVYFSKTTAKALWNYLRQDDHEPTDLLFVSERGTAAGGPFTRSGVLQFIHRLGKVAGITATRCSPHTFRHTSAVMFLRAGGSQFALMSMLGHTDLKMTARYVKLAEADVQGQHNQFSPVEALKKGKGK